jgi:hypothetical protein
MQTQSPSMTPIKIRRTRAQWKTILAEFEQSELSVQDFCQQHDLAYSSFAKWRSLLKQENKKQSEPVSFIPMPPLSGKRGSNWIIELDLGAGVILRLTQS